MKRPLSLEKFSLLLLATLAKNSKIEYLKSKDKNKKVACLPASFKQNIENILCEGEGWQEKFSCLIDIEEYFDNHFTWEWRLSLALIKTLDKLNKKAVYNYITDNLQITFTQEEVDLILSGFKNKKVKDNMEHFANLLGDYMYTREYKEKYYNKDEKTIQYMRELDRKKNADLYDYGY